MSTAETVAPAPSGVPLRAGAGQRPVRSWWRLLRSELYLVFRRWRNLALLAVVAGLPRLLFVTLYIAAGLAALGAIGLAVSTFTEHPIAAIAAVLVIAVASEVADNVPQFHVVQPYLPTHWWLSFDSLLRSPIATSDLLHGLLSFGAYIALFRAVAWARFTSADVTS